MVGALTGGGGEGMVIKPREFVARGKKGLVQPALKVRGHEYLRIIYGPEYDAPENLVRLRERGLGGKRNLALREFALGHEALKRFVAREPLRRVHECVFAVWRLRASRLIRALTACALSSAFQNFTRASMDDGVLIVNKTACYCSAPSPEGATPSTNRRGPTELAGCDGQLRLGRFR